LLGVNYKKIETDSEIVKVYPIASQDLNDYIKSYQLKPKESLFTLINIAEGVRELHKHNILHLDLSPTNILLSKEGIKIIDFDAASIKNNGIYTRGFVGGYKKIIPPELFDENPVIGEYSDTYELAVLLYRLAIGSYPYEPTKNISKNSISEDLKKKHLENKLSIPQNTPDGIKRIIEKGIKPEPKDRYQNVNEMLLDLLAAYNEVS
jgi:eukaryotic-like serine/threonine-protein kinase